MRRQALVRELRDAVDALGSLAPAALLEQLSVRAVALFDAVGASWCALEGDRVRIVTTSGLDPALGGVDFPLAGSAVGQLVGSDERSLVDSASRFPHLNDRIYAGPEDRVAVALAAPGGQPSGALYVVLRPETPFGAGHLELLELLAGHAGAALRAAELLDRAERARAESAAVLAAMADGVALVDSSGTVLSCNAAMARMTGRSPARTVGRSLPFALPEAGQVRTSRQAGGRWVDVVVAPAGRGGDRVVSARDVTTAKELEEAQELFLATASHELRSPLTVVRGFGETLLRHWEVLEESRRFEIVERMVARSSELSALVDRLLAASLAGATRDGDVVRFDLAQSVRSAVEQVDGASDSALRVDAAAGCWAVGRPETVAPVLEQLLENALKYAPAGSPVDVSVSAEDGSAVLRVADRGQGFAEEERERVFDRFVRGAAAVPGRPGAGLGLWIVRRTVEAQDGAVAALPRPGGGAVVEVRLPAG